MLLRYLDGSSGVRKPVAEAVTTALVPGGGEAPGGDREDVVLALAEPETLEGTGYGGVLLESMTRVHWRELGLQE